MTSTMESYGPNGRDAVFVLDDRPDMTELAAGYFESAGIPAFSAGDAPSAWTALEARNKHVKLALIDKNLQQDRNGGLTFIEEARRRFPEVAFVLITGWTLSGAERIRIENGNINWLDKGAIDPASLMEIYRQPKRADLRGVIPAESKSTENQGETPITQENLLRSGLREETIGDLRTENKNLRNAVREIAGDLIRRLRNDFFSTDEAIFINGRDLTVDDLIDELESCTPLGMRLLSVHFLVINDLIDGKGRRGKK